MSANLAPNAQCVATPGRRTVYSLCGMCAVRCPMEVTVEDGRVTWLQGNTHDPGIPLPSSPPASDAPLPAPRPRQTTRHAHSAPSEARSAPPEMATSSPSLPVLPVGSRAALATRRAAKIAAARRQSFVRLDFLGAAGKAANLGG